jgi:hypothetical protein
MKAVVFGQAKPARSSRPHRFLQTRMAFIIRQEDLIGFLQVGHKSKFFFEFI